MIDLSRLRLKKNEDRRLRNGHLWVYSNEIDTQITPIKNFTPGEQVLIEAADKKLLGVGYVNPNSLITARLFSRDVNKRLTLDFFIDRMKQALTFRNQFYIKPCYRLIFAESDFLPGLIIDRFFNHFAIQINTTGMELHKDSIIDALREVIPETESILFRNDTATRQYEGLENYITPAFGSPPESITLEENETIFEAPFFKGQKTGWFYDHRLNRSRLKDYVNNQRVLDVFSYLGAWGIQAANYGAKEVTCIDSSSLSETWISKNATLNHVDDKVNIIIDDAFEALKKLRNNQQQFDVVILDPPAFIKKQKDLKAGLIAYQRINELALQLLTDNGILISCSCSMHLEEKELQQVIRRSAINTQTTLQILERGHQAPDHPVHIAIPETNYLKMLIGRKIPLQ